MNSHNFSTFVLHPNTEQDLIKLRNSLLSKYDINFFPIFPLFIVSNFLQNEFFNQKELKELKNNLAKSKDFIINKKFIFEDILFFLGSFSLNDKKSFFIIPCAVNKFKNDKTVLSIYKTACQIIFDIDFNNIQNFKDNKIELSDFKTLSKLIKFKTFQLANCKIEKNQFFLYDNIWLKVNQ